MRSRDMDLPRRFFYDNRAYFVLVSRDRIRFHVHLVHRYEEWTNVGRWKVWLEDNRGRRFRPERADRGRHGHFQTWFLRYSGRDTFQALGSVVPVDFFYADGDVEFYKRDLYDPTVKWIRLVMKRPGYEYTYTWRFTDEPLDEEAAPVSAAAHPLPDDARR